VAKFIFHDGARNPSVAKFIFHDGARNPSVAKFIWFAMEATQNQFAPFYGGTMLLQ